MLVRFPSHNSSSDPHGWGAHIRMVCYTQQYLAVTLQLSAGKWSHRMGTIEMINSLKSIQVNFSWKMIFNAKLGGGGMSFQSSLDLGILDVCNTMLGKVLCFESSFFHP